MKKLLFVFAIIALLSSCKKNKCYILSDCLGNDTGSYCGTKKEVQDYCAAHSPAGCTWTYRLQ